MKSSETSNDWTFVKDSMPDSAPRKEEHVA